MARTIELKAITGAMLHNNYRNPNGKIHCREYMLLDQSAQVHCGLNGNISQSNGGKGLKYENHHWQNGTPPQKNKKEILTQASLFYYHI